MGKFWAIVFLSVPILGVLCFALAPAYNIWLPVDISTHGHTIDHLFKFILILTGIVFVATEVALFWFLWRYDGKSNKSPTKFVHGSHTLEVVWTVLPASTLVFIALYQMNAWADTKMRKPNIPVTVEVTARQFEWRLRYPGDDGVLGTRDDLYTVNTLHVPVDEEILVDLKSQDVLHSFFLPHVRVKQDAVPGMRQPVWFQAKVEGEYDLVCAELCGWGHYKMKGRLIVQSRRDYDAWLAQLKVDQEATQEKPSAGAKPAKDSDKDSK